MNRDSYSATVLWIMGTLGPRPAVFGGITHNEQRRAAHHRLGLAPIWETARWAYLRGSTR